jgi:hypothetical protein
MASSNQNNNIITVTACDNELDIIAYRWNESIVLARVLSGNSMPVNVTFHVVVAGNAAPPAQPVVLNGTNNPLNPHAPITIHLPASDAGDPYSLQMVGINWGASYRFTGAVNDVPYSAVDPSTKAATGCVFKQTFPFNG